MEAKFSKKAKMGKENEPQGSIKKGFVLCPEPLCFKHIIQRGLKTHLLTHHEEMQLQPLQLSIFILLFLGGSIKFKFMELLAS